jgi:cellobiose epimerase
MSRVFPSFFCFAALVALTLSAMAVEPASAVGERPQFAAYKSRIEEELRGNILKFWIQHVRDRERGGFYGEISNTLEIKKDAPRGSLLTSRILWTYSAAYRRYRDPAYLEMAKWAYDDLAQRFWDREFGGVYWLNTADGKPLNTRKQIYGQVFALYALSEFHRATGDADALSKAIALYRLIEQHARDGKHGGYFEVCTREWSRELNPRNSSLEAYGAKSQNTHLHVMEAYTNLLRVWPDEGLRNAQRALVEVMLTRILDSKTNHLVLFFTENWTPRTKEISFGHDIEASWLLTEAADVLGDQPLIEGMKPVALAIADVTLREGVDEDGSLLYEAVPGRITKSDREWWPQAEAAVGFYNAYQLSGEERYLQAAWRVWDFIEQKLVDRKHGEWFRAVSSKGVVSAQPKVSLWKCPYHNGRACLELLERIERTENRRR